MNYIYYSDGRTGLTGRKLVRELGISSQRSLQRDVRRASSVTSLIRWGVSQSFGENPKYELNTRDAIALAANKQRTLRHLQQAGIRVPELATNKNAAQEFLTAGHVLVGRPDYHQGGSDFRIIRNLSDLRNDTTSSHWTVLYDKSSEWRIHVFRGEVIGASKKISDGVEHRIRNQYARNHTNGWRFFKVDVNNLQDRIKELAVDAVAALGLDFGAVDIILSSNPRRYYVLEVNTAPSLEENSTIFNTYLDYFSEWFENPSISENIEEDDEDDYEEDGEDEVDDDEEDVQLDQLLPRERDVVELRDVETNRAQITQEDSYTELINNSIEEYRQNVRQYMEESRAEVIQLLRSRGVPENRLNTLEF